MFKASMIMTADPITVAPETPVLEAMQTLVEHDITGLPVVAADGALVGMISEKDLLQLAYDACVPETPVGELMTTEVIGFGPDDDIVEITECLITNPFRRVPILDEGRLVGVVSRRDIIRFIMKFRNQ
jgi:CBS domain-containing protein